MSGRESASEIEAEARSFAASLKWWMACKTALHELEGRSGAGFPKDPPPPPDPAAPTTPETAAAHITGSRFWKEHDQFVKDRSRGYIERRIGEIGADYEQHLGSDEWVQTFSGKEMLRHLRTKLAGLRDRARGATPTQIDESLGVQVARELKKPERSSSRSAEALRAMRAALRARARTPS